MDTQTLYQELRGAVSESMIEVIDELFAEGESIRALMQTRQDSRLRQ